MFAFRIGGADTDAVERRAPVTLSFTVTLKTVADWYHRRRRRREAPSLAA